jgi:hypothetical protein
MLPQISPIQWLRMPEPVVGRHPIHVAGNLPNLMNRFYPTNGLEVLFVN